MNSLALAILSTVDCNIFSSKINDFSKSFLNGWIHFLDPGQTPNFLGTVTGHAQ